MLDDVTHNYGVECLSLVRLLLQRAVAHGEATSLTDGNGLHIGVDPLNRPAGLL